MKKQFICDICKEPVDGENGKLEGTYWYKMPDKAWCRFHWPGIIELEKRYKKLAQ